MVFVADDLGAWLVGLLADAGRRKLTTLVLGTDQQRAIAALAPLEPARNLLDIVEDHRRGALDGPAHQVPGAVAVMDLGESPVDWDELAVRASGHVAAGQHAGKHVRRSLELQGQDVGESAFSGFGDGVGVMGDQLARQGVGLVDVAQVAGAVEGVQACHGQAGRVADVVQPRGGVQEMGVRAQNRCQAACPLGDALDVRRQSR